MRRTLTLSVLIFTLLACASRKLTPCPTGQVRAWCLVSIDTKTWDQVNEGLPGCTKQVSLTMCVQDSESTMTAIINTIVRATAWISMTYTSGSLKYLVTDVGVVSADFVRDSQGVTQCFASGQSANPWPGTPVVEIPAGTGSAQQGLGGSPAADCASCLADGCAGIVDQAALGACSQEHCAALCPLSPAGACGEGGQPTTTGTAPPTCGETGAACSAAALCCAGLFCYADGCG